VRVESGVNPAALRDARLRMGLTQHELARLIDVAGGERISRWGLGSSAPRPEILHRLAQALHVGAADLLEAGGPVDLRRLRASAGLSARALAARAHISVPTPASERLSGVQTRCRGTAAAPQESAGRDMPLRARADRPVRGRVESGCL
jgi:transcriptional regulator with XRE-family HTH domain